MNVRIVPRFDIEFISTSRSIHPFEVPPQHIKELVIPSTRLTNEIPKTTYV
jgi:hypothetical protein